MAALTAQAIGVAGTEVTFAAASAGGDTYEVTDDLSRLIVKNDDAGATTVTLATPGQVGGLDVDDRAVNVPAGATVIVPLLRGLYRDPADGLMDITYSSVTSLTVAVVR